MFCCAYGSQWIWRLARNRRGAIAPLVALALPALMGAAALAVDAGFFYLEQQRLQVAADAAAVGAAYLLPGNPTAAQLQSAAQQAAQGATGGALAGTLATPIGISATASAVTVTLTSQASGFFSPALRLVAPALTARATAGIKPGPACVLALNTSISNAIEVAGSGTLTASNCGVFANSPATSAINVSDSGSINAQSVAAVGGVTTSSSGTLSPSPPITGAAARPDPYAQMVPPSAPATCNFTNATFNGGKTQYFTQSANVFCGNTTFSGNTTGQFDAGIYYIVNGNLTFTGSSVSSSQGTTFVLTGTTPGSFNWTGNSNGQISAPTSGPTAGIAIWQTCGSGGSPANVIDNQLTGSSVLTVAGGVYAPCGELNLNGNVQMVAAPGETLSVVADLVQVSGHGVLDVAAGSSASGTPTFVVLMQ